MDSVHGSLYFRYLALMVETVERDFLAHHGAAYTRIVDYASSGRDPMDKEFTISDLIRANDRLTRLVAKGRIFAGFIPTLTQEELESLAYLWDYERLERAHRRRLAVAANEIRAARGDAVVVNIDDLSAFEQVKLLLRARERRQEAEAADPIGPWSKDV